MNSLTQRLRFLWRDLSTFKVKVTNMIAGTLKTDDDALPETTATYSIGSTTKKWEDLHLNGDANIGGNLTVSGGLITKANVYRTSTENDDLSLSITDSGSIVYIDSEHDVMLPSPTLENIDGVHFKVLIGSTPAGGQTLSVATADTLVVQTITCANDGSFVTSRDLTASNITVKDNSTIGTVFDCVADATRNVWYVHAEGMSTDNQSIFTIA